MDIAIPSSLTFPNPFKGQDAIDVQQYVTIEVGRIKIDRPSLDQLKHFCQTREIHITLSKEAEQYYQDMVTVRVMHRNPTYRIRFSSRSRHPLIEQDLEWKTYAKPTNDRWEYEVSHTYLLSYCFQILSKYGYCYPKKFDKRAISDEVTISKFEAFVTPTEHQKESVSLGIKKNGRCLICDDPGLGKTISAGLVIKHFFDQGLARRGLWIVPTVPVALQTVDEIAMKFNCDAFALYGNVSRKKRLGLDETRCIYKEHGLIVTTWSTFTRDWTHDYALVMNIPFDFIVCDENHLCNSDENEAFKAVLNFNAAIRIGLTGTPLPNGHYEELYNILYSIDPLPLPNMPRFRDLHAQFLAHYRETPIENEYFEITAQKLVDKIAINELQPIIIRHDRSILKDAIPKINETKVQICLDDDENYVVEQMIMILTEVIKEWQRTKDYIIENVKDMVWQDLRRFCAYGGQAFRNRLKTILHDMKDVYSYLRKNYSKQLKEIAKLYAEASIHNYPKFNEITEYLQKKDMSNHVLIFCDSVKTVIDFGLHLHEHGFDVRVITGKYSKNDLLCEGITSEEAIEEIQRYETAFSAIGQKGKMDEMEIHRVLEWFWSPYMQLSQLPLLLEKYGIDVTFDIDGKKIRRVSYVELMTAKNIYFTYARPLDLQREDEREMEDLFENLKKLDKKFTITRDKKNIVGKFTPRSPKNKRILITTNKLAEGCNIQIARTVIFFDYPLSIKQREQRISRIQRMGSPYKEVYLIAFICGLEYAIERTLSRKYESASILGFQDPRPVSMKEVLKIMRADRVKKSGKKSPEKLDAFVE